MSLHFSLFASTQVVLLRISQKTGQGRFQQLIPVSCQYPPIHHTHHPTKKALPISEIMEVYTTSFTYPRRSRPIHSPASSLDYQHQQAEVAAAVALAASSSFIDPYAAQHQLQHQIPAQNAADVSAAAADADAVQKLAMMAMSLHGCHVSYHSVDHGRGWNFHITGAYQQVMNSRGLILKECPIQVSNFLYIRYSN